MRKHNEIEGLAMDLGKFDLSRDATTRKWRLVAEVSDFGPLREGTWWLHQLWNDSCDVGISIRSHTTGKVERFYLERKEVHDGDLLAYHFKPVDKKSTVESVTLFND